MLSSRRLLQLTRACRAGFQVTWRRTASVGAVRLTASWSPARAGFVGLSRASRVNSLPVSPALFCRRGYADLPPHKLVGLPALSPTMETGTIVAWEKEEGEELMEGDIIAQIETDKATMDMETPREGYLAKILLPAGTKDIPLGKIVCVIVSEEDDVAAFKDFQVSETEAPAAAAASSPPPEEQPSAAPPPDM